MGTKIVDVKTRLRLDDLASRTLSSIKQGFADADGERKKAQSGFGEFARTVASVAVGQMIMPAISRVREFTTSFFESAKAAQANQTAITAVVAANNKLNAEQSALVAAKEMGALDEIALKTQHSIKSVRDAFNAVLELQGGATKNLPAAEHSLDRMGIVANKLGMDVSRVAREFGAMGDGMVETKGHLFQILWSTGIFGKSTHKAAEYWAKLTDKSRHQQLAYGLDLVAKKMEAIPDTYGDLAVTLENIWEITKQKLGEPLLAAVMPELKALVGELMGGRQQMGEFAKGLGHEVGSWVRDAARDVRDGFKYLKDHHEEIGKEIKAAFTRARDVVSWILAHKEEIAVAFGARAAVPVVGAAAKGVGALTSLGAKGSSAIGMAGTGGGLLASGAVVAAFAAAVASWVLAIGEWRKLMAVTGGGKGEARMAQDARREMLEKMAAAPELGATSAESLKRYEAVRDAYVRAAKDLGDDSRAAGELADRAWQAHRAVRAKLEVFDRMKDVFTRLDATGGAGQGADFGKAVDLIDKGFADASAAHNVGMQRYIADVLSGSTTLQKAFLSSSSMTSDGFRDLADMLKDSSKDFADKLRALADKEAGSGAKSKAPVAIFTGPITVKQDFRQQDPDRVAVAFRRDMGKQAEVRVQSTWTSPFGT